MIAQRGVKLHPSIKQRLVRDFKFLREVSRLVATVDIVPKHDHEIETYRLPIHFHFFGDIVLFLVPRPAVANHREAHGVFLQRQLDVECCLALTLCRLYNDERQQEKERL